MNQTLDAQSVRAPEAEPRTPWESIDPDEPLLPPAAPVLAIRARAQRQQAVRPPVIAQHLFEQTPAVSVADPAVETAASFSQEDEEEVIERAYFSDAVTFDSAAIPVALIDHRQLTVSEPVHELAITAPASISMEPEVLEPRREDAARASAAMANAEVLEPSVNSIEAAPMVIVPSPLSEQTPWESIGETAVQGASKFAGSISVVPAPVANVRSIGNATASAIAEDISLVAMTGAELPPTDAPLQAEDAVEEIAAPIRLPAPRRLFRSNKTILPAEPQPEEEFELVADSDLDPTCVSAGGGWTIPLMCFGIGMIACCAIIPQAEANRFLMHEHQSLAINLQSIEKQVSVNEGFLKSVADNPTLAERLASRQMKTIRKGERVLEIAQMPDDTDMSPFALVDVALPPEAPAYQPLRSTIADLCNDARSRLYLMGASFLFIAVGLVLGSKKAAPASPTP